MPHVTQRGTTVVTSTTPLILTTTKKSLRDSSYSILLENRPVFLLTRQTRTPIVGYFERLELLHHLIAADACLQLVIQFALGPLHATARAAATTNYAGNSEALGKDDGGLQREKKNEAPGDCTPPYEGSCTGTYRHTRTLTTLLLHHVVVDTRRTGIILTAEQSPYYLRVVDTV